jgi:Mg2+ and Co2+ transporter CorA
MTPIESIYEIKSAVIDLQKYLCSKNRVVSKYAQTKYEPWVDRFFRENEKGVKPEQRQSCLRDLDYFLKLMDDTVE